MNGKVIVHIGLPKTATTTLQTQFFPALADNYKNILYTGVHQPRSQDEQSKLYRDICKAVFLSESIDKTKKTLRTLLNSGKTIIVSEEMFTVSQGNCWREQLLNLSKLLQELDYQILVTVREPSTALFSFYTELYDRFLMKEQNFINVAKSEESFEIFHYQKLSDELLKLFEFDRIVVFPFEQIITGNIVQLGRLIMGDDLSIECRLQNHNKKSKDDIYVHLGSYSMADLIRILLARLSVLDSKYIRKIKMMINPVTKILDSLTIGKKKLIKPNSKEMNELKVFLKDETVALENYFGISYK